MEKREPYPWTFTITLARKPICPSCATMLDRFEIKFRLGVAVCRLCYEQDYNHIDDAISFARSKRMSRHCYYRQGLIFYMPQNCGTQQPTIHELWIMVQHEYDR